MVDLRLRLRDGGVISPSSPAIASFSGDDVIGVGRPLRESKKDGMPSDRSRSASRLLNARMPTITTETRRSVSFVSVGWKGSGVGIRPPGDRLLVGRGDGKRRCCREWDEPKRNIRKKSKFVC
jgi:hypothetical protein